MAHELRRGTLHHPPTPSEALFLYLGKVQCGATLLEEVVILHGALGHALGVA